MLLYEKKVDGMTAEERVAKDRRDNVSMGKIYWDLLRDKYSSEESPLKRLKVHDDKQVLMPQVEKALLALLQKDKDFQPLLDFLEHGAKVTDQKSWAVLCRQMTKVPCLSPERNYELWQSLMAYIARHDLSKEYPVEFNILRSDFDKVLSKSYSSYKTNKLPGSLWWQGHSHVGALLIPEASMEPCCSLPKDGSWSSVESHLYTVVNSSETGKLVFGFAVRKLQRHRTTSIVDKHLSELFNNEVTSARFNTTKAAFIEEMQKNNIVCL